MTTVIEYVRHTQEPLRADLSPADALALSCLIYVDFHALPGPRSPGLPAPLCPIPMVYLFGSRRRR